ncbi:MAG: hypothetical protein IPP34_08250 [Bacteroidetes bacterium]|nr:hypothetical protein [Bacteroidota bacterium]
MAAHMVAVVMAQEFFKYNFITQESTYLHYFESDSGSQVNASPFLASNGKLYGSTIGNGTYGGGSIFEFDLSNESLSNIYQLNNTSGNLLTLNLCNIQMVNCT